MESEEKKFNLSDFKYIEMGNAYKDKRDNSRFERNVFLEADKINEYRMKKNNSGVYRSSYWYDNKDPYEANLFGDFYLDFDSEDDIELAKEDALMVIWKLSMESGFNLPNEAFHIYFSGFKGFHIIIPYQYFGYKPSPDLNVYFKLIAKDLYDFSINKTLDLKIYDRRRLFRLENSIHQKTGLFKIPLTYSQLSKLTSEEITEKSKTNFLINYPKPTFNMQAMIQFNGYIKAYEFKKNQQRVSSFNGNLTKIDFVPHCIQHLEDSGPISGQRNETVAILTSFWKNQDLEKDEILEKLLKWNNGQLKEKEIRTTMWSILRRDHNYGCSTLEVVSECIGESCKLYRKK